MIKLVHLNEALLSMVSFLQQVCGDDGQTYSSAAALSRYNCETERNIRKEYQGPCRTACDEIDCSVWKECIVSETTGLAYCRCPEIQPQDWITGEVCTQSQRTYPSLALAILFGCIEDSMDPLESFGRCDVPRGRL